VELLAYDSTNKQAYMLLETISSSKYWVAWAHWSVFDKLPVAYTLH